MKKVKFLLRLPPDIDQAVRMIAKQKDRSVSWVFNDLLRQSIPPEMLDPTRVDLVAVCYDVMKDGIHGSDGSFVPHAEVAK